MNKMRKDSCQLVRHNGAEVTPNLLAALVRPVRLEPDAKEWRPSLGDDDAVVDLPSILTPQHHRVATQNVERPQHKNVRVQVNSSVLWVWTTETRL